MAENRLEGMHFVSSDDITPDIMRYIMIKASDIEKHIEENNVGLYELANTPHLRIGSAFFEDSTRTRISFETAAELLGGVTKGFAGPAGTSLKKKESLRHTLEMIAGYGAKAIVIRHSLDGAARWAAESMERRAKRTGKAIIPILNGGDGKHEHPTQTVLTRYVMLKDAGRLTDKCEHPYSLEGMNILVAGDLLFGRVPHSNVKDFSKDGVHFIFVAPDRFQMPEAYLKIIEDNGSTYEMHERLTPDIIGRCDALSAFRFQIERFSNISPGEVEEAKAGCRIVLDDLVKHAKPNARVYHPLPINKEDPEIDPAVDDSKYAAYFEEAACGVPTRIVELAISLGYLGEDFEGDVYHKPQEGRATWRDREDYVREKSRNNHVILPLRTAGTVFDRLPLDTASQIMNVLGLDNKGVVHRGGNVRRHSRPDLPPKGILMIEDWEPSDSDLERIAYIAGRPESDEKPVTVNHIQYGEVVRKVDVYAPKVMILEGQGVCPNGCCVSRPEEREHAATKAVRFGPGRVQCYYCDTLMDVSKLFL